MQKAVNEVWMTRKRDLNHNMAKSVIMNFLLYFSFKSNGLFLVYEYHDTFFKDGIFVDEISIGWCMCPFAVHVHQSRTHRTVHRDYDEDAYNDSKRFASAEEWMHGCKTIFGFGAFLFHAVIVALVRSTNDLHASVSWGLLACDRCTCQMADWTRTGVDLLVKTRVADVLITLVACKILVTKSDVSTRVIELRKIA